MRPEAFAQGLLKDRFIKSGHGITFLHWPYVDLLEFRVVAKATFPHLPRGEKKLVAQAQTDQRKKTIVGPITNTA